MDTRCPCCHTTFTLEHAMEDESLREMRAILADLPREVSRPLVAYIGLFRGKTRAMAYERQLRIMREALALATDTLVVGAALSDTVEAIRTKRDTGEDTRPLRNHNYLKRVVETLGARAVATRLAPTPTQHKPAAKGMMRALEAANRARQS